MANLSQLKTAMATSVFLSVFIFGLFIFAVVYVLGLDMWTGLFIAFGCSTLFILIQFAIGPSIVAMSTKLKYVKPGESPWLEETVKELAEKSGLPMPKLAIVPSNSPNAFTFGRTTSSATLAVHEGLLRHLNQGEIRGVIAHELGHIKHKDYAIMTILSALPLIAYMIARSALFASMFSNRGRKNQKDNSGVILIAIGVISFLVYIITFAIVMRLSRLREHFADAFAAYVTNSPHDLGSALAKITYGLSIAPKPDEGARAFYIGDPSTAKQDVKRIMENKNKYDLDGDGVLDEHELQLAMEKEAHDTWTQLNNMFATHPPTFKRILLLKEIEKEMDTGKYTNDQMYSHV
ncbi:MAG: M48 family metalloprotease [Nitrososphaerota archaeon]|uniref:zinc metalloprotease HtpX n=1 Tax=Candidatus Bathycorpusculum sp. TaxID=2994959 RepID=UPI0028274D10|nr:zinc metalloprotease HtpX [Candidatus Termiticorpusculum sp.]MCL2256819.1 zinc metalloprotease HtpX [Candidatus Termiticorpusculum sp.]MCL2293102.1 zinc metalloprotease HtpX [Candidatus Termiticorpusculum sp.]MDR0460106.1 M48 family metalloprotease [Nitrososphaerota archaeon]